MRIMQHRAAIRRLTLCLCFLAAVSLAGDAPPFPKAGLLPKGDIGALRFLAKHAEHDGRGVIVAIIDTGVDPGAEGLQTTADGRPKVVDLVDATGSGDVDLATIRKPADGVLEGLTGRKLKAPAVNNPSGEFRLGIKRAWDIFPDELVARIRRVRREAWELAHRQAETKLRLQIDDAGSKLDKSDLQARLDMLKTLAAKYDDPGPVFDCAAFHDGTSWRALIDTDEDGDLADEKPLTDYHRERQWSTFGQEDRLNFAVNFYDDGRRLSIFTDSGSHGTHVAGIVAGHYPNEPERNGVAPGAQIVGIKIGDTRLAGMETGTALLRATQAIVRNKCDLLNMSYGEPTTRPDRGLLVQSLAELVNRHNVIFVSSAGNAGPALTTAGAPGATTSSILGVGAYLSPEMMSAQYSHREPIPATAYTFTSRGPARDGDLGIAIFAPGGAVAPVPQWTLHRSLQMNGTSMASPNACGGLALLLSGLKANKTPYNPFSVRRAIQNTALPVEGVEVFAQGPGLLQVDKAWDYLQKQTEPQDLVRYEISIFGRDGARGIYIRDPIEVQQPRAFQVVVEPKFPKDPSHQNELQFDLTVSLESTQPWVDAGTSLHLVSGSRGFEVRVDPTGLTPGAHYAEVRGFDSARRDRGPLFRVPITVLKPLELTGSGAPSAKETLSFVPGQIVRQFVAAPTAATWATLELKRADESGERAEPIRVRVDVAEAPAGQKSTARSIFASLGAAHRETFPVTPGEVIELCFVRDWRSIHGWTEQNASPASVSFELTFHSLRADKAEVFLPAEGPAEPVRLTASFAGETLAPAASFSTVRQIVKPSKTTLRALSSERDRLPGDKQLHELILEYEFDQSSAGSVTPRFPVLDDLLYDSDFGTMFWMLFDASKRRVESNDIFADPVSLTAGKHTLRLQVRHPEADRLEKIKDLWLALDRSFGPLSVTVAAARPAMPGSGTSLASRRLEAGESLTAWVVPPASFGSASPGDILLGTIRWTEAGPSSVLQTVVPTPKSSSTAATSPPAIPLMPEKPKDTAGRLAAEVLEFRVRQLQSLKEDEAFEKLSTELLEANPDLLPVHLARLRRLDDDADKREERLPAIVAAADAVLAKIDIPAIQMHFGANINPDDSAANAERQRFTQLRETLIDTLYRKGRALGYMDLPEVVAKHPIEDKAAHDAAFEANFAELRRWVVTTDAKYYLLHLRRERRKGRPGNALQLLLKHTADAAPTKELSEKRRDLCEELGWTHQLEYERRWLMVRFPADYEGF